ncbi:hypothetical protein AMELA_G00030680 [Ameiurus melas]|uniref:Phosphorylase b kinase regulatory subunit n=1 Tax=Ameiurus melas TaxID=219545 RepID=A0A7J6B909_AMEME|nr:hypothetical protein AMELA_G00030680 [Ameiurus melas]
MFEMMVEKFKQDPSPYTCLHSVFNVHTGDEIYSYKQYSHLQIDAVCLFLLYLVEMICSGLQIIYNNGGSGNQHRARQNASCYPLMQHESALFRSASVEEAKEHQQEVQPVVVCVSVVLLLWSEGSPLLGFGFCLHRVFGAPLLKEERPGEFRCLISPVFNSAMP